jgi:hypothetical protein
VLYNAEGAACVAAVVARALQPMTPAQRRGGGMALLCDPEQGKHRAEFEKAAAALGLETAGLTLCPYTRGVNLGSACTALSHVDSVTAPALCVTIGAFTRPVLSST